MSRRRRPGTVDVLPNGMIRARYYDDMGKRHSKVFPPKSQREANAWIVTQLAAVSEGRHVAASRGKVSFREFAEEWRAARDHRESTAAHVESHLRRHVYPHLGDLRLSGIEADTIERWLKGLRRDLQPATVSVIARIVASIFRSAVRRRFIVESPFTGVRLPTPPRREVQPLDTATVRALEAAMPPHLRALVTLAAGTGLRLGEAVGVTVDRIDWPRATALRVDRQLATVNGRAPYFAEPKTHASTRTVPLPRTVRDALARHLAEFPARTVTVPDRRPGSGEGATVEADLIFTSARGYALRRTTLGDIMRTAAREAGAPAGTGFHALRHYYASLLIRHGESVKTVQARLGHTSAVETLDTYSHLWPDSDDRTRDAVDAVLGAAEDEDRDTGS